MKTRRILRSMLLLAVVFVVVWCLVVFYWRATDANPSSTDLALYLGALPLGLVGSYWLLRKGIERLKQGPATPAAAEQTATATPEGAAPADFVLELIASAIRVPAGASGDEVAQGLIEPKRPELHPQLKDSAGLPVLAAQVEALDTAALADALAALVGDGNLDLLFPEERQRALTLIDPVADELLLAALEAMPPVAEPVPLYGRAPPPAPPPALRVQLLLPGSWPQAARQVAADWLLQKALATGFEAPAISIESLPVAATVDVWKTIAAAGRAQHDAAPAHMHLLLAAQSQIGEASVERLGAQGRLLSARRQEGLIPGEAAAGVLLTTPALRPPSLAQTPPPQLQRLAWQRRDGTATQGKATTVQLHALLQQSLASGEGAAEKIAAVISDADHRPSRATAIAGAVSALLPELDPMQKCLNLGVACGDIGIVAPLALIAVAAAQSAADSAEVMVVGLGDDDTLGTLTVAPAPSPDSTPAAQHAAAA